MRLAIFFLFIGFYACGQQASNKKHGVDQEARRLNDSAMSVMIDEQDYGKAMLLLDQAIQIDSNYLTAHVNKLSVLLQLKKYDQALQTANKLIKLKPQTPDYYVTTGVLYYLKNDTISANKFFNEAVTRYDVLLDTMKVENEQFDFLRINKAISLVLVGREIEGNKILKQIYDRQDEDFFKELIMSFMNKSKQDIINNLVQSN